MIPLKAETVFEVYKALDNDEQKRFQNLINDFANKDYKLLTNKDDITIIFKCLPDIVKLIKRKNNM